MFDSLAVYLLVSLVALLASGLTLFSGFGLGTLLLPAFLLFFPVQPAIAMTAVVHFLNNLLKLFLLGKKADRHSVLQFGLPAMLAALCGAWLLLQLGDFADLASYTLAGHRHTVTATKLVIALLMLGFALLEASSRSETLIVKDRRFLAVGGLLSGFFGGLSGHQGAFRSAFLVASGLSKEAFIATGVIIACLVDLSRLSLYATSLQYLERSLWPLIATATLSAFLGVFIGTRLLPKVTIVWLKKLVAIMLCLTALLLAGGII
ncbi:MAG: TSUP family transporter [Desulfuromonadaceae bacterium]